MLKMSDLVDNNIEVFFPDHAGSSTFYYCNQTRTFRVKGTLSLNGLIDSVQITAPYLIFQTWNGAVVRGQLVYMGCRLKIDSEFSFDIAIGIPLMVALQSLYFKQWGALHK